MEAAYHESAQDPITEMAIVRTFTKLIFGDEEYSPPETRIIEAFRSFDANVRGDDYPALGEYLRNLGVREMIQLVARLQQRIVACSEATVASRAVTAAAHAPRHPGVH
ncbi:MAG: hypothetical protein R3E50_07570 [Halioglobus sp.]